MVLFLFDYLDYAMNDQIVHYKYDQTDQNKELDHRNNSKKICICKMEAENKKFKLEGASTELQNPKASQQNNYAYLFHEIHH